MSDGTLFDMTDEPPPDEPATDAEKALAGASLTSGMIGAIIEWEDVKQVGWKEVSVPNVLRKLADKWEADRGDPELEQLIWNLDKNERVVDELLAELKATKAKKGRKSDV